jgi:hypothetical protein
MAANKGRVDASVQWTDIALRCRLTPYRCGDVLAAGFRLDARYE